MKLVEAFEAAFEEVAFEEAAFEEVAFEAAFEEAAFEEVAFEEEVAFVMAPWGIFVFVLLFFY